MVKRWIINIALLSPTGVLAILLVKKIGILPGSISIAVLAFLCILPGAIIASKHLGFSAKLEQIGIGTGIGICFQAASIQLVSILHSPIIFWVISALIWGIALIPNKVLFGVPPKTKLGLLPLSGVAIATVISIPKVLTTIRSQAPSPTYPQNLYTDLPWHISLVGNAINKPAEFFPYLLDEKLSYTWGLHGFLAWLTELNGTNAAVSVLTLWPILFAIFLPIITASFSWVMSKNKLITFTFPILISLSISPIFTSRTALEYQSFFPISPTLEYSILLLLTYVAVIQQIFSNSNFQSQNERLNIQQAFILGLLLSVISFSLTMSKGSAGIFLIAGSSTFLVFLLRKRSPNKNKIIAFTLFSILFGFISANLLFIRTSGGLKWNPFSFYEGSFLNELPFGVITIASAFLALIGVTIILARSKKTELFPIWGFIAICWLGSLLAILAFWHEGHSQVYFYLLCYPLFVFIYFWAVILESKRQRSVFTLPLVSGLITFWFIQLIMYKNQQVFQNIIWAIVIGSFVSTIVYIFLRKGKKIEWVTLICIYCLLPFSTWIPKFDQSVWSYESDNISIGTVTPGQIEILTKLRSTSSPQDVVATNRHCLELNSVPPECDTRYFVVSAYSERQVFIEGWGYEGKGTGVTPKNLQMNDEFFSNPSDGTADFLRSNNVKYLYVDKTLRHSSDAEMEVYADLLFENQYSQVWKFK